MTIDFVIYKLLPICFLVAVLGLAIWMLYGIRKSMLANEKNEQAQLETQHAAETVLRDKRWADAEAAAVPTFVNVGGQVQERRQFTMGGLTVTSYRNVKEDEASSHFIEQKPGKGWSDYETTRAPRPSWPKVWMDMAGIVASRSYDPRLQVGCVIIPEDNTGILSLGYNGNACGLPNEPESTEPGQSGFIHAEANALIKCDYNYPKKKHLYVTHSPCRACAKLIIQGGISRVVYKELYRDDSSIRLLQDAGIEVLSYDEALITNQT